MINHEDMEKRQRREQIEHQVRMTETVRQDSMPNVLPPLFVVHDPNITVTNFQDSVNYLGILLGKVNRLYSNLCSLSPRAMERAKPAYYKALCDVRDFSIHCLELSGELLEKGALDVTNTDVVRLARFFCDIQDSMPSLTPLGMSALSCIDIFDSSDPFETTRFRCASVGSICSLATIPSGRILLKTLFDLRYYDPKLDRTRRDHGHYLPSTMRIRNPFTKPSADITPSADTTQQNGLDGQIVMGPQPKVMRGDFRQDAYIFPPIVEYNGLMQSMLTSIPPRNRSHLCSLQHLAQVDMGHEMIHTVHISYGVALNMPSSSIRLEERVTAGDAFGTLDPNFASATTRADSVVFDHADDSVKEAFIVSEQSLRRDYGTVARHSYGQKVAIDSTDDTLTEDERYIFLFTDELINDIEDISYQEWPYLHEEYPIFWRQLEAIPFNEAGKMNILINAFLKKLEKDKSKVIDGVFDGVLSNMIFRQYGNHLTPQQQKRAVLAQNRLGELLKSKKSPFFDTIITMIKIRIKKDILALVMLRQSAGPASATAPSSSSPAASAAASAAGGSDSESDD